MFRRDFVRGAAALLGITTSAKAASAADGPFPVTRSKAEWKAKLTSLEYRVMREEGTERAFTSPLNNEKRDGMFHCKGCDQALYASEHKYDSGTGWPSFWQAQAGSIGTKADQSFFMVRTECHCSRCGSHLGHIFDDGPQPAGKRRCNNWVTLTFRAA